MIGPSASSAITSQADLALSQSQAATSTLGKSPLDLAAAKKAAQNFEQVFLSQMFGHMFSGLGSDSMFGGGHGEEMFRPMLIDEYSKSIVKHGGLGIADAVMHTLISQQEKSS